MANRVINEVYDQCRRDVAFKLRSIREHEGYSVTDWAKKLGVSCAAINGYEGSKKSPNLLYCYDCCRIAGLKMEELVLLSRNDFIKKLFFG